MRPAYRQGKPGTRALMIGFRFIILVTLTFLPPCLNAQIYISGEIEGTFVDTTYIVEDDVVINRSLTIEPGACLQFMAGVQFDVNGALHAIGTEEDSIYFKSLNEGEQWGGIDINDTYFADIAWCIFCQSPLGAPIRYHDKNKHK